MEKQILEVLKQIFPNTVITQDGKKCTINAARLTQTQHTAIHERTPYRIVADCVMDTVTAKYRHIELPKCGEMPHIVYVDTR